MVEACERRILEFPLEMDAREVAKELKARGLVRVAVRFWKHYFPYRARAEKSARLITLMILPKPAILEEINGPITPE